MSREWRIVFWMAMPAAFALQFGVGLWAVAGGDWIGLLNLLIALVLVPGGVRMWRRLRQR